MSFERSQMLYNAEGYYRWQAAADHDNPYYRGGTDYKELNKTEGYEVLYFINHFVAKHYAETLSNYQKAEKMIRYDVPGKQTHKQTADYLLKHW